MPNYVQPDFRIPVLSASVTVFNVESEVPLIFGPTGVTFYVQPMLSKEDPQGTIRAGKSGKGSAG